jgi:uncharacterized UPF0146 family protein
MLEIGAGTGWQAKALQERGFDIKTVDLATSNYKNDRIFRFCAILHETAGIRIHGIHRYRQTARD